VRRQNYDRLLADLGTLTRILADRLAEAEAEIERLRAELGNAGGDAERAGADARADAAGETKRSPQRR